MYIMCPGILKLLHLRTFIYLSKMTNNKYIKAFFVQTCDLSGAHILTEEGVFISIHSTYHKISLFTLNSLI